MGVFYFIRITLNDTPISTDENSSDKAFLFYKVLRLLLKISIDFVCWERGWMKVFNL